MKLQTHLNDIRATTVTRDDYEKIRSQVEEAARVKALADRAGALVKENERLRKTVGELQNACSDSRRKTLLPQLNKLVQEKQGIEDEIDLGMANVRDLRSAAARAEAECKVCKTDPKCPKEYEAATCATTAENNARAVEIERQVGWQKDRLSAINAEIDRIEAQFCLPAEAAAK